MEQKLLNELNKLLEDNGCELLSIENVSVMGESYVVTYKNHRLVIDSSSMKQKILSLISRNWNKK